MVSFAQFRELLSRPPSLRGFSIEQRIRSGKTRTVYAAFERSTLGNRQVHLVRPSLESVVGLAYQLQLLGLDYQALRLRRGDVCFVTASEDTPEWPDVGHAHLDQHITKVRSLERGQWLRVGAGLIGVSVLVGAYLLGDASKPSRPQSPIEVLSESEADRSVISPSKAPTCSQDLDASEDKIVGFLENGATPEGQVIDLVSTLENGGIRSVVVSVECLVDLGAGEPVQKWRVGLMKSGQSWIVTKMTRLIE